MDNIAVIYKSHYGVTRRYAEWIAQALGAQIFEASKVKPSQLSAYDIIVYGGGLYAGGIDGVGLVTKNPCKSLVVFTVGLADPAATDYFDILNKNFTPSLLASTKVFHLRGGIDYKKLGFAHKGMMAMMKKMILNKAEAELSGEDRVFLETYGGLVDFTDRNTIEPIVECVKELVIS